MSIAELKLKVIERVAALKNEAILNLILTQLEKDENEDVKFQNLSQDFESISNKFDNTLKKLAR